MRRFPFQLAPCAAFKPFSQHRQRPVTKQPSLLPINLNRESAGNKTVTAADRRCISARLQCPSDSARFISLKYPNLPARNFPELLRPPCPCVHPAPPLLSN